MSELQIHFDEILKKLVNVIHDNIQSILNPEDPFHESIANNTDRYISLLRELHQQSQQLKHQYIPEFVIR